MGVAKKAQEDKSNLLVAKVQAADADMVELKKIIGEGVAEIRYLRLNPNCV